MLHFLHAKHTHAQVCAIGHWQRLHDILCAFERRHCNKFALRGRGLSHVMMKRSLLYLRIQSLDGMILADPSTFRHSKLKLQQSHKSVVRLFSLRSRYQYALFAFLEYVGGALSVQLLMLSATYSSLQCKHSVCRRVRK